MFDAETQTTGLQYARRKEPKEVSFKKHKNNDGITQEILVNDDEPQNNIPGLEDLNKKTGVGKAPPLKSTENADKKLNRKLFSKDYELESDGLNENDSLYEEDHKPFIFEKEEEYSHEVFVRNLPFDATKEGLRQFFNECGVIERVNFLRLPDGKPRGVVFIKFSSEEGVQKAVECNGRNYGGRVLNIEKTIPRGQKYMGGAKQRLGNLDTNSAFVANISYSTDEYSLRQVFETCGEIKGVRIPMTPDGKMRGFAFIDFVSPESIESAIKLTGTIIDGRPVRVDYSGDNILDHNYNRGGARGGSRRYRGDNYGRGNRSRGYERGSYHRGSYGRREYG